MAKFRRDSTWMNRLCCKIIPWIHLDPLSCCPITSCLDSADLWRNGEPESPKRRKLLLAFISHPLLYNPPMLVHRGGDSATFFQLSHALTGHVRFYFNQYFSFHSCYTRSFHVKSVFFCFMPSNTVIEYWAAAIVLISLRRLRRKTALWKRNGLQSRDRSYIMKLCEHIALLAVQLAWLSRASVFSALS